MPSNRNSYTLNPEICWKNTCWDKRNRLEKILIAVVTVLSILVLILFIITVATSGGPSVCTTPECVKAAKSILDFIDPTKDPCNDFYAFTCGTFNKNAHQTHIETPLAAMTEKVNSQLTIIITEPTNKRLPKSLRLQRRFYRACMNTTAIEEDKNITFLKLLEQLGGWPVMKRDSSWDETNFHWTDIMVKSRNLGLTYARFLEIGPMHNEDDSKGHDLKISYPYISKEDKLERDLKEDYIDYMSDIAAMFGASNIYVRTELRNSVEFQEQLFTIIEEARNETKKELTTTINELQMKFPQIYWLHLINNLTGRARQFTANDTVIIVNEHYLHKLMDLLQKTSKRIQSNFIIWELIENNVDFLSQTLRDRKAKFKLLKLQHQKQTEKKKKVESRKDLCIRYAKDLFPDVAEAEFVRQFVDKDILEDVENMIIGIKNELRDRLRAVDWMDQETRKFALQKLENIKEIIGGPAIVHNADAYEKFMGMDKINFHSNNLIEMRNAAAINGINRYYRQLNKRSIESSKTYMLQTPWVTINSYFSPKHQTMILSAGMLQGLFHDKNRPRYMNYGALGGILGHEYTHGFLIMDGLNIVKDGTNETWWSNATKHNFVEKSTCLIDEYESFSQKFSMNVQHNGTETLEENIADFTGADLAYAAYDEWVQINGNERKLPGLNYTPRQLFWIAYSFYMCFEKLSDSDQTFFADDKHGVPSFRIVGPLRNSRYFADDFSCPVNSYMNPKNKCQIF